MSELTLKAKLDVLRPFNSEGGYLAGFKATRDLQVLISAITEAQSSGKRFEMTIAPEKRARSLTANAYAWELIGRIADVLRADKDAVYVEMLKRYGQRELVMLRRDVNPDDWFKYFEPFGETEHNGIAYIEYMVYRGSSEYDTREMAVFIDGIVSEAKALDIETLTPQELSLMEGIK